MTTGLPDAEVERHLRLLCLRLPEATEKPFGGHTAPSFRVRDKIFLMTSEDRGHLMCKVPPGVQQLLVGSNPDRFFVPAYVGSKGWIGIRMDADVDWEEIAELAEESYRAIAPKRLVALLDQGVDDLQ
jgi:predicted DNA-binding protein (MmcQ/YjbR family)